MDYTIPAGTWKTYYTKLSAISKKAAEKMLEYILNNGYTVDKAFIDYAYALSTRYGEAAGELASQMYDYCAEYWSKAESGGKTYDTRYQTAEPSETASYGEVAKTMNGIAKTSINPDSFANAVGRMVKQTAEDTTLKNAARDGTEFAWVPNGDTCPFCIMLASNGWQRMSKKAMKGAHAEHIHANCDCTYAVRFGGKGGVDGYDPDKYLEIYDDAEGDTWQEKLNSMRRKSYAENGEKIREQKRAAYAVEKTLKNQAPSDSIKSTIHLPDIAIGKSLGAKAKNYNIMDLETGGFFRMVEGTYLQDVEVFAGKGVNVPYRKAAVYAKKYGGEVEDWQHTKGSGTIDYYGEYRRAEIHWSQCERIGKVEFFIKKWLE